MQWALRNRHRFPVDVNRASKEDLLRVPGLGVQNVTKLLKIRRFTSLRWSDLARLRVPLNKTKPFLLTADFEPTVMQLDRLSLPGRFRQMSLFDSTVAAVTGEL